MRVTRLFLKRAMRTLMAGGIYVKEMGGYMELELKSGSQYYEGDSIHAVDTGRSAIWQALEDGGAKRLFLPEYICESVLQVSHYRKMPVVRYTIDENFLPVNLAPREEGDAFLYVNWFGIQEPQKIRQLEKGFPMFLLDNTQAFFAPVSQTGYTICSARKFFGVSDGAYVIKEGLKALTLPQDISYPSSLHLLKRIELGAQAAYEENLENEKRFDDFRPKAMSLLTRRILEGVDYNKVKESRRKNFEILHDLLGKYNELRIQEPAPAMVYPLLVEKEHLRQYLVQRRIYVPHWWKAVLQRVPPESFEAHLSRYLVPLPMDQRYDEKDMRQLARVVQAGMEMKGEENS